ncbi:MAG: sulfite reductase, beta subunit (hemoprotein) [Actinobacteria bacterium]|nr:sulfite reductase, beta subunit (hemoprotein) [Actinomycetota bacterium]
MAQINTAFQLPQSITEDTLAYGQKVREFLDGQTRPAVFKAYRIPRGIYEQRQAGAFMVRVRVPAGMILPEQIQRLAELSRTYGNGVLHITTRQDVQIHQVKLKNTPIILESLLEVGLSSRGGGGNTVRNITACPRAGVCPNEAFDVRPYAIALSEYLLDSESSFNLPRKFKVAFSGCSQDCALASVTDLGFFAHLKDTTKRFSVYAGGGMGSNSRIAAKIKDFILAKEVFSVAEAMKRLFDQHGDRTNKHRARLRYVLERLGRDEFIRLYQQQREKLQQEHLQAPAIRSIISTSKASALSSSATTDKLPDGYKNWRKINVLAEKKPGEFTIRLRLALGDISADDFEKIASLADMVGEGVIRTTQLQDLLLCQVREDDLPFVFAQLSGLKTDVLTAHGPKLIACAGASTCRQGLCRSRGLATAIADKLRQTDLSIEFGDEVIRISGCPNSCGHHLVGAIGLQGRAKRVGDRLVPCYAILVGGKAAEAEARLAEQVELIPAKNVPALVSDVLGVGQPLGQAGKEQIAKIAAKYSHIPTIEEQPDVYRDFGDTEDFSLAGRGPGECGAGVMDVIQLDIDQAKQSLDRAKDAADGKAKSEVLYKAIVAAARSLLITRGLEPKKDREIFTSFSEHLIEPGWIAQETKEFLDQALDYRLGDTDDISHLEKSVEGMLGRVEELFRSLDANLNFRVEPISKKLSDKESSKGNKQAIDLRGVECPLNFVKAKLALEKIDLGQVLEVVLDAGEPVANVSASFAEQGQEVLNVGKDGEHFHVTIRKKKQI